MNLHLIKNTKIYIQTSESVVYPNLNSTCLSILFFSIGFEFIYLLSHDIYFYNEKNTRQEYTIITSLDDQELVFLLNLD